MLHKRLLLCAVLTLIVITNANPGAAAAQGQVQTRPFGLPMAMPASPSTWLFGQPYGNTIGSYNFGKYWYNSGQRLHFGIDLPMPCGTPVVAVGDAEVVYVDSTPFGAGPHNVVLRHPQVGVATVYGHLHDRSPLVPGQVVKKGQQVGVSGDPDLTCDSRPHLHLEVRSLDYRTAYNPIVFIDAPWHVLAAIGSYQSSLFQQDLRNPRRWMSLDDQPAIQFRGAALNDYALTWPPVWNDQPPPDAVPMRDLGPLPESSRWQLRPVTMGSCCPQPWWEPYSSNWLFALDGTPGQLANIIAWTLDSSAPPAIVGQAPPPFLSPDGTHQIVPGKAQTTIRRLVDGKEWTAPTQGFAPALSTDNSRLMWEVQKGQSIPGSPPPKVEIWVSTLGAQDARLIVSQAGGGARWLDSARLLIASVERTKTTLAVYDTRDATSFTLGTWAYVRSLSVAPGGGRIMFYRSWQPDRADNVIHTMETRPGAQVQKLPWFGSWRWRDANSVYYIPFTPNQAKQTLAYYHIPTGTDRKLTDIKDQGFTVANGDWNVSPDGRRMAFQNVEDMNIWLLEDTGPGK